MDSANKIKVLIVDDSSVVRGIITKVLQPEPDIEILATAVNGQVAVNLVSKQGKDRFDVDIIILDIEMPEMDGLTAIPLLLAAAPKSKILMVSTLTQRNAEISIKALSLGAADYVPKPTSNKELISSKGFNEELLEKIRAIGGTVKKHKKGVIAGKEEKPAGKDFQLRKLPAVAEKISALAIGSSTGGPEALVKFFSDIKGKVSNIPIFVTQHMPPVFTTYLAKQIGQISGLPCEEAMDGTKVLPGHVYLAPGDFHMVLDKDGNDLVTKITKTPPENFCRPAVDPMLRSVSEVYGKNAVTIILTGMGQDGLEGAKKIVEKGGVVIAQDEKTSVVWGMPGSVAKNGLCSAILPIEKIGKYFNELFAGKVQ